MHHVFNKTMKNFAIPFLAIAFAACEGGSAQTNTITAYDDMTPTSTNDLDTITLGAGCFWCVEAVFIERDANFPEEADWRSEVQVARQIALEVEAQR